MSTITFDTLKFVERLEKVGIPREQAAAMAEAFNAAQSDVQPITKELLEVRLLELENRLVKWGIGLALGQAALVAALVKLIA